MLASNYPLFDVFLSTLYVVLFLFWMMLALHVLGDVFTSHDLTGATKALWIVVTLILPLAGCLIYVVVRGGSTHERRQHALEAQQKSFEDYIRAVANTKE